MNGEVHCFTGSHILLAILALVVLVAAVLVLPLCILLFLKPHWKVMNDHSTLYNMHVHTFIQSCQLVEKKVGTLSALMILPTLNISVLRLHSGFAHVIVQGAGIHTNIH